MSEIRNGVDVDKLKEITNAMKADPVKAQVKFQAETKWVNCAHSKTKIRNFTLEGDEPISYLGSNRVPNPVETILAALGSCLAIGFAYNAAARGINLESLDISLEGNLDLQGFLGISDSVRPGYQNIEIACKVKSDASHDKLKELFEHVQRTSPVLDIIRNAEPITIIIED
ncbi:MAG TPA: OsmC family protein [Methanothrix sp.]